MPLAAGLPACALAAEPGVATPTNLHLAWAFALFAGTSVALGSFLLHRSRAKRLLELERIRTRIATDLHDDIGAGLSQVAILAELAQRQGKDAPAETVQSLERIALVSRELVDSMSDIVWAVDPHRDTFGDLAHRMRRFANDVLLARDIELTFEANASDADAEVPADLRRQVYLVFKEAVNNAVQHSGCSRARICLRRATNPERLELIVEDDGIGFELEGPITGVGLGSLVTRARQMGGTLDLSSIEGRGTTVTLIVPLERFK